MASSKKAKSSKAKSKKPAPKKPVAKKLVAKKKPAPKKATAPAKKAKKPAPKPAPKKVAAKAKPTPKKAAAAPAKKKPAPKQLSLGLAPAISRAFDQAAAEGLISRLPPPVQPVVTLLRKVVLEVAPEASEQIENGTAAYFANGVFARIEPSEHEVLVRFLKGGQLPSAAALPGDGETRALTFKSVAELRENVLRKVVREAVMLNLNSKPVGTQPQA